MSPTYLWSVVKPMPSADYRLVELTEYLDTELVTTALTAPAARA
jgi:hypothetical protein